MADLSTLDPTQPPGTQAASQGDDRIRETRDAIINSFGGAGNPGTGGTQPEHNLNGVHHFHIQDPAFRPAAGNPGRIFFDATNLRAEYDSGAVWNVLHSVLGVAQLAGGTVNLTNAFQNLTSVKTFNAGNNQYLFLLGYVLYHPLAASDQVIRTKFVVNGTDMFPGDQLAGATNQGPSNVGVYTWGAAFALITSGPQIVQYMGKTDGGTAGTAVGASFIGIAF